VRKGRKRVRECAGKEERGSGSIRKNRKRVRECAERKKEGEGA
jgi:hypothetical protein